MELPLLPDFVIIFGLSIGVLFVCHKVRIPPIVGFLITGVLAGPSGLGLVKAAHEVEIMAEIGVVLLLFSIGLELSLGELARLKKPVLLGGAMQVVLTILLFYVLASALGMPVGQAVFIGFLAALSSTAIVLLALRQRDELESPQGRICLSILIFQDLIIVPMMLFIPILAGGAVSPGASLLLAVAESLGLILLVFFTARKIAPWILRQVARTRSRELFLITTLALCLSIALLTSKMGLSLSLGAFMAGLIISDSEFSLSAMEGVLPFRDVFTSIFFISVGMLMDAGYFLSHLPMVCGAGLAVLAIKTALAGGAALALGYPLRPAIIVGLSLSQVGEFSFVLAKSGLGAGLLDTETYQLFLSVSILTMAGAPFMIALAPGAAEWLVRLPGLSTLARRRKDTDAASDDGKQVKLHDHLIIVGFGMGGRHLARAARMAGIAYNILEMNPDTVKNETRLGEPISYGDAAQEAVLSHAGIADARVLAVVIPDPVAVRRITEAARRLNPALHIIARTRFTAEIGPLMELGANDVIPEEFETSIEIFTRALFRYLVPRADIEHFVDEIRGEGYEMLRELNVRSEPRRILGGQFSGMDVSALRVDAGAALAGQSLKEAALRKNAGLTVVVVSRDGRAIPNPDGSFRLQAGDVAYVFGPHARISSAVNLFRAPAGVSGEE
jgi:monovalent cation:H+ antiporter-2, CPA2 family